MAYRPIDAEYDPAWPCESGLSSGEEQHCATRDISRTSPGSHFDVDAWTTVIEDQRLRIARAAGVDPSRVRIRIGH